MLTIFENWERVSLITEKEIEPDDITHDFTAIVLDKEDNVFKIVSGPFADKKDAYRKLTKRGFIVRKVMETVIFEWIEENAKSNLEAYAMYSTAFSKWRGNNLLGKAYVKLLKDIPELNREGNKGNPATKGMKYSAFGEAVLHEILSSNTDNPQEGMSKHRIEIKAISEDIVEDSLEDLIDVQLSTEDYIAMLDAAEQYAAVEQEYEQRKQDKTQIFTKKQRSFYEKLKSGSKIGSKIFNNPALMDEISFYINDDSRRTTNTFRIFILDTTTNTTEVVNKTRAQLDKLITNSKATNLADYENTESPIYRVSIAEIVSRPYGKTYVDNKAMLWDDPKYRFNSKDFLRGVFELLKIGEFEFESAPLENVKLLSVKIDNDEPIEVPATYFLSKYEQVSASRNQGQPDKSYGQLVNAALKNNPNMSDYERKRLLRYKWYESNRRERYLMPGEKERIDAISEELINVLHHDPEDPSHGISIKDPRYRQYEDKAFNEIEGILTHAEERFKELQIKYGELKAKRRDIRNRLESALRTEKDPAKQAALEREAIAEIQTIDKLIDLVSVIEKQDKSFNREELLQKVSDYYTNGKGTANPIHGGDIEYDFLSKVNRNLNNKQKLKTLTNAKRSGKTLHMNFTKKESAHVNSGVTAMYRTQPIGGQPMDVYPTNRGLLPVGGMFYEDADELNPVLFENGLVKEDVRKALLFIAKAFIERLELDIKPVDIYLTGSNANYNYTTDSDIDLHVVYDYEEAGVSAELLTHYLKTNKQLFNETYDILVKGIRVEVGSENLHEPLVATGVYSLINNEWIKKPEHIQGDTNVNSDDYSTMTARIENVIQSHDLNKTKALWKEITELRKSGLETGGEFDKDNLLFKKLRSNGYLNRLHSAYIDCMNQELSLECVGGVTLGNGIGIATQYLGDKKGKK